MKEYLDKFACLKKVDKKNISMVLICCASDVITYDRRTPELSNASLLMKQDATSIEKNTI